MLGTGNDGNFTVGACHAQKHTASTFGLSLRQWQVFQPAARMHAISTAAVSTTTSLLTIGMRILFRNKSRWLPL